MSNIKFSYLYRDGSNFKKRGEVVFFNPDNLASDQLEDILRHAWGDDGLFLAHEVRIPEVFLYGRSDADADDHCFHELDGIEPTEQAPNDERHRTMKDFIAEVQTEGRGRGVFEPFDRWLRRDKSQLPH